MDSRNQKENIKEFVRRWNAQTGAEEESKTGVSGLSFCRTA